ncbi:MAG: PIN domain-containing protein [Chloroflexota bacterium]
MSLENALSGLSTIFLDSAPVIYYVERKRPYFKQLLPVFKLLDDGLLTAVTSPITLAECIFYPYKQNNPQLAAKFRLLLTQGPNTHFKPTNDTIADQSAQLRARYNLGFADALQIATAVHTGCDAFLTNDAKLQRVADLQIIVLEHNK